MYVENKSNVVDFASVKGMLPPQNIEAEEAILGGILVDPNAMERVKDVLQPKHFYVTGHARIYEAALKLNAQEKPTDLLSVTSWLNDNGFLEIIGGRNKLASLVDITVSAVNIDAIAQLVIGKWKRRQLGKLASLAIEMQHKSDDEMSLDAGYEQLQDFIYQLQRDRSGNDTSHISEVAAEAYQRIELAYEGKTRLGLPTGFYDFDSMINGLISGELIVIAGRPGMGKSALAVNIAFNVAINSRVPVAVFSLEMSKLQITFRLLSGEVGIESALLKGGRISKSQWEPLSRAVSNFSECPLYLNEVPSPSLSYIEAEARRIATLERRDLGLIVVDYLQLMDGGDGGGNTRNNEIAALTRGLKRLAMKLNVPVICLSQLNRAVEMRTNKRPILSDLRDSGGIEQDSDKVIMLYRDDYYHQDSPDKGLVEIIIAKHREGATGTVSLLYDAQFTKFKNLKTQNW